LLKSSGFPCFNLGGLLAVTNSPVRAVFGDGRSVRAAVGIFRTACCQQSIWHVHGHTPLLGWIALRTAVFLPGILIHFGTQRVVVSLGRIAELKFRGMQT